MPLLRRWRMPQRGFLLTWRRIGSIRSGHSSRTVPPPGRTVTGHPSTSSSKARASRDCTTSSPQRISIRNRPPRSSRRSWLSPAATGTARPTATSQTSPASRTRRSQRSCRTITCHEFIGGLGGVGKMRHGISCLYRRCQRRKVEVKSSSGSGFMRATCSARGPTGPKMRSPWALRISPVFSFPLFASMYL